LCDWHILVGAICTRSSYSPVSSTSKSFILDIGCVEPSSGSYVTRARVEFIMEVASFEATARRMKEGSAQQVKAVALSQVDDEVSYITVGLGSKSK
jgi:hypothetical protein